MAEAHFEDLLRRNQAASDSHTAMPLIKDAAAAGLLDQGRLIILTCADARADPAHYLHLSPGELSIIRNAGGRVTEDVLSSLELISTVGGVGMVVVIHHTDCGCLYTNEDTIRDKLQARSPQHAGLLESKNWGSFQDIGLEQSVRDDVFSMRRWPFLPAGAPVLGYVFDIQAGTLRRVEEAADE